ncbi:hypothetical protein CEXT_780061, partial [Caerostris extrusa]
MPNLERSLWNKSYSFMRKAFLGLQLQLQFPPHRGVSLPTINFAILVNY